MPLLSSKPLLADAQKRKYAVGAFNILDENTSAAIVAAAKDCDMPVILQTSVKTVEWYGAENISGWVQVIAEKSNVSVSLNLDHCRSFDLLKRCIMAGWTDVMFDCSHMPLEENIRQTAEVVAFAKLNNVSVEGELGAISGVEDDISVATSVLTEPDDAERFVEETGVDVFAPAIGTAHGMYHDEPVIDFERLERIRERIPVPIAIHGGTGLSDKTIQRLIRAGGSKINVSTAIKQAFSAVVNTDTSDTVNTEPLDLIRRINDDVREIAHSKIMLFTENYRPSEVPCECS